MTDKIAAAKAIRNLAVLYRDMEKAAEALEAIGTLDQAAEESRRATETARAEYNILQEQITASKAALQDAQTRAKAATEDADRQGTNILCKARDGAAIVIAEAEAKARDITVNASESADEIIAAAEQKREALSAESRVLADSTNALTKEIIAKKEQLRALEAKVAGMKADVLAMLG